MQAILVRGHNPGPWTGEGTNTYLLPGPEPTLIDAGAGAPRHLEELRQHLAALGLDAGGLARLLVTHAHVDHIAGTPALRAAWPALGLAKFPWPEADAAYADAWAPIRDDEMLEVGGHRLWALHTPGHSPDHLAFFEPRSGTLFGGDLVQNGATIVIPVSRGGSLAAYLASLRRLLDLQPRRILPGHGSVISQPAALLRGYLAHRLQREQQIVDALQRGPATVDTLVGDLYPGLAPALAGGARENVLAHLLMLESARHARVIDNLWSLV